jgi:hypothetical protein
MQRRPNLPAVWLSFTVAPVCWAQSPAAVAASAIRRARWRWRFHARFPASELVDNSLSAIDRRVLAEAGGGGGAPAAPRVVIVSFHLAGGAAMMSVYDSGGGMDAEGVEALLLMGRGVAPCAGDLPLYGVGAKNAAFFVGRDRRVFARPPAWPAAPHRRRKVLS